MYDDMPGYDEEVGVHIATNLTEAERLHARILYRLFNELWGLCVVIGDPGTGKDLFGNWLALTIRRYFPWKRILRDEKPRKLFGEYADLFNESVLRKDLANMRMATSGKEIKEIDKVLDDVADKWVTGSGEVLLKDSLLYLTEFWRYCYNREPHNPMNKTMGAIHKMKRHLDCLIVGTGQITSDLDKKTCLKWVDWVVTSTRAVQNKTGFVYFVQKVKWDQRNVVFVPIGKPHPIPVDAGKPRHYLGDGKIVIRKPNYEPQTDEERIVLYVLKAGVDNYEELVEIITSHGDMTEGEILAALKELKFRPSKRAIDYPCLFGIFNSKSAPQIKTSVKVEA